MYSSITNFILFFNLPVTFDNLCQNVYIIMLLYAEEKGLYILETGRTVALFP